MQLDPTTIAGLLTLISAVTAAIVTIISAVASSRGRTEIKQKVDLVAEHAAEAADKARVTANQVGEVAVTSARTAVQTNSHLSELQGQLAKQYETNLSLQQTVAQLTAILSAQQIQRPETR